MRTENLAQIAQMEASLHAFPWSERKFREALAAGYSGWQMYVGQTLVGYAVVMLVLDEAHLLTIGIASSHQNQGWGKILLRHLFDWSHPYGAQSFFLEVRPSNVAALALYRQAGFETVGRRKNYYEAPQGREDALVMKAAL